MPAHTKHLSKTGQTAKAKPRATKRGRNGQAESCVLREDSPEYSTPPRFIDLFCGIGGFRIAFEKAGGRCVFSSDYDKFSQKTFEIIHRTLTEALGYTVYHKIIDARSVLPQHRERIFFVGFREWR